MTLPTVGEILRAERDKQGLTVKDVEKGTSIRALYIQAIEDGKYGVLPGEVYLKGFIRNYASFLGLDPQKMMEIYRENQVPQQSQPTQPVQQAQPAPAPAATRTDARRETKGGGSTGRWLIALLVIALVAGGAWAAMNYLNQPAPAPTPKPPQAQTPVQPAPTPATPKPAAPAPAPAARPVTVAAKYTADCWTQVIADGREIYEGIPKVGDSFTWNADQTMTVRLGNAAGVELTYNGQPQGRLGGAGEVITRTFPANTTTATPGPQR